MKKLFVILIAVISASFATIVSDSDYAVSINSTPDSAHFEVFNESGLKVANGHTPNTIMLSAGAGFFDGETYTIKLTKTGYKPTTYVMKSGIDGWYIGNIFLGGWLGMLIIDPATGAMYTLPERIDVNMDMDKQLSLVDINTLTDEQRASLVAH